MIEGVARDLDDDGALLLETADGARVRVIAGEVLPS
jgi:biotin-(acetyl-CoA carboxylase) ligase